MRKLSIFIILFFCLLTVGAQQVSLQDVANRTYRAEGIRGIKPMLDGEHYTCLLYTSPSPRDCS